MFIILYVGDDYKMMIKRNIEVISDLLHKQGLPLMDLSFDLPAKAFAWEEDVYPNEHLSEQGRMHVAEQVVIKISESKF